MLIVYCKMPNMDGQMDDRPLGIFSSMEHARKFLRVLAANNVYAAMKEV